MVILNYVTLKFRSTYWFVWGHELANWFLLLRLHRSALQIDRFAIFEYDPLTRDYHSLLPFIIKAADKEVCDFS